MKHDLKLLALAVIVCLSLIGAGAVATLAATADNGFTVRERADSVRIYGCKAEDDCRIDYRGDRQGRGVWIIHRDRH